MKTINITLDLDEEGVVLASHAMVGGTTVDTTEVDHETWQRLAEEIQELSPL